MFGKYFLRHYSQASLPVKIGLPFILLFGSCWAVGTFALGEYFTSRLEKNQRIRAEELAALVEREIEKELDYLRTEARLLSIKSSIIEGTEAINITQLRQNILPLKGILDTDLISVIDTNGDVLFESRQPAIGNRELQADTAKELLLTGSDLATVGGSSNQGPPILIGTAPIKTEQGVEGGILVGIALNDERLGQVNKIINEQLVIVSDEDGDGIGEVVASTFSETSSEPSWLKNFAYQDVIEPNKYEGYLVQEIRFANLDDQQYRLVLLVSKASLYASKRTTWVVIIAVSVLGTVLMSCFAIVISRMVAQPIQDITQTAQQVVEEQNFKLRATPKSDDEIGALAQSLNQMIQWVGEYTHALEESAQKLESRVEARTQELSETIKQLKETQGQLIQTEKMSSLGQMVAGIAHEINNPISFIQGNLSPLQEYFEDLLSLVETYESEYPSPTEAILEKQADIDLPFLLEDTQKTLGSIKMGTQRVRDIVVSLRNYSRLDEAAIKDVDLHEGINNTLLILNHRIKQGVEVIKDYGNLPTVRCSPSQLNQVFTNIIANALDAMFEAASQPKQLTITTCTLPDRKVQISLKDSGPGMSPEIKAKIFDPFFTTKAVGKGTGLGMGICFKIVEQHQGSIAVETAVGHGTEFIITLPLESSTTEATDGKPLAHV